MSNKLYQVLIVDNEVIIRNGLHTIINWNKLGFFDPFLAENGTEAIKILKANSINALLTDIRMPGVTGLELIRIAKEISPNIKVVIISGYDKFEYAFEGIKLQVEGFILKPIDPEPVEKIFLSIKEKLDNERKNEYAHNLHHYSDLKSYSATIIREIEGGKETSTNQALLEFLSQLESLPLGSAISFSNELIIDICSHFLLPSELINDLSNPISQSRISTWDDLEKEIKASFKLCLESINLQTDKMAFIICVQAKKIIEAQYKNPNLSIRNISKNLSVSYGYLSSAFPKYYGISLKSYLIEVRMKNAKMLLLSRSYKIKDVAEAVGYYNPRYFSDAFTRFYGKSPSEFLQQINENSSQINNGV